MSEAPSQDSPKTQRLVDSDPILAGIERLISDLTTDKLKIEIAALENEISPIERDAKLADIARRLEELQNDPNYSRWKEAAAKDTLAGTSAGDGQSLN